MPRLITMTFRKVQLVIYQPWKARVPELKPWQGHTVRLRKSAKPKVQAAVNPSLTEGAQFPQNTENLQLMIIATSQLPNKPDVKHWWTQWLQSKLRSRMGIYLHIYYNTLNRMFNWPLLCCLPSALWRSYHTLGEGLRRS